MGRAKAAGKAKEASGIDNLRTATDTLSCLLAREVRELARCGGNENGADGKNEPGTMKGMKEVTAVLKDLAAVAKTLSEQGTEAEGAAYGVVLLPAVDDRQSE